MTRSSPRTGVSRERTVLLTILSIETGVLVITGVALFFVYRPSAGQAWDDVVTGGYDWNVRLAQALRIIHRFAGWLAVFTAVAAGVAAAIDSRPVGRRLSNVVISAGMVVTALAAFLTGLLLPWDQLALWAVTVGTDVQGYAELFDDRVRFVISRGVELSPSTVIGWLLVHGLVLGPALIGLILLAWRRHLRSAPPSIDAGPPRG